MEEKSVSVLSLLPQFNTVEPSSSLKTSKRSSIVEQNSLHSNAVPSFSPQFASSNAKEATEDEPNEKPTGAVKLYSNNNMTAAAITASTSRTSTTSSRSTSALFAVSSMAANIDNSSSVASKSGREGEEGLRDPPVQQQNPVNPESNRNRANNNRIKPIYFKCPFCPFRIESSPTVSRKLRAHYQHHKEQWLIDRARRIRRARGEGGSR